MAILDVKRVLITDATGALGRVLLRRLLTGELGRPRRLMPFSRDEAKQHALRYESAVSSCCATIPIAPQDDSRHPVHPLHPCSTIQRGATDPAVPGRGIAALSVEYLQRAAATDDVIYRDFERVLDFRIGDVRDYASVCAVAAQAVLFRRACRRPGRRARHPAATRPAGTDRPTRVPGSRPATRPAFDCAPDRATVPLPTPARSGPRLPGAHVRR